MVKRAPDEDSELPGGLQMSLIPEGVPNPLVPGATWTSHQFVADEVMDDQFRHHLSLMYYGMSDLGECLEVARTLVPADEESWMVSWTDMARRLQDRAESSMARGKTVSAASAYLRAATYWRASLMHFGFANDPRVNANARASSHCYERSLDLSGYPGQYVQIPYEGSFLPGHFYRSPVAGPGLAPVLIFNQGRDAWPEDTRWVYDGAIRRGIHCLAFHGPGQGLAIRLNNLPFRHDWENVVTPVVDFVLGLEGVDAERIGLMGLSFGGYLAPRAAAFEHRIKLCIADPGVLNWGDSIISNFPSQLTDAMQSGPQAFNAAIAAAAAHSPTYSWFMRDASWTHGVATPYELIEALKLCDLTPFAHQIECETLIIDGTEEVFSTGQPRKLYDALTCKKHFMLFDETSTAQLHCQNGANATAAETMFDWLDERL
ncbi:MAG: alpha/beta fold hydrolase [Ilumatobacteraceae bacterium]